MRLQKYINEKYLGSKKLPKLKGMPPEFVEVFVNPSNAEMNKVSKDSRISGTLRFTADNRKKKLYVWNSDTTHYEVWNQIIAPETGEKEIEAYLSNLLTGVAEKEKGKWIMNSSDIFYPKEKRKKDWSWVEKWIDVSTWLSQEFAYLEDNARGA